jgi:hypothetical protein
MRVIITLDRGISRYAHRLATLANELPRAEREGLKEGGDLTRTLIRRTLKAQMNTKRQGVINSHTSGGLAGDRLYIVRGTGMGLPIEDFPVKGGRKRRGDWHDQPRDGAGRFGPLPNNDAGKVVAQSWGVAHRFKRSYATKSGQFVARLPGTRSVRKLYGPSVAKEIGKDQSAAAFEAQGAENVERCIIKRLGRLL